jgi:uncharacterized OB-fold protein
MTEPTRPLLPSVTDLSRPFWDGCRVGELRFQSCIPNGHLRYPISEICPVCLAAECEWRTVSGRGAILSFGIFHRAYHKAWEGRVPYNVALIQLDEGPRMFSNVVPLGRTDLEVGAPVRVVFEHEDGVAIPRFEPA